MHLQKVRIFVTNNGDIGDRATRWRNEKMAISRASMCNITMFVVGCDLPRVYEQFMIIFYVYKLYFSILTFFISRWSAA